MIRDIKRFIDTKRRHKNPMAMSSLSDMQFTIDHVKEDITEELREVEGYIIRRGERLKFSGQREELFDIELKHKDFSLWDWEDRESHNYDLGMYHGLKRILNKMIW